MVLYTNILLYYMNHTVIIIIAYGQYRETICIILTRNCMCFPIYFPNENSDDCEQSHSPNLIKFIYFKLDFINYYFPVISLIRFLTVWLYIYINHKLYIYKLQLKFKFLFCYISMSCKIETRCEEND